ncbi:MAG: hypothetical protein WDA75_05070 [Candidatus Latescibacterota bacterium]
MIEAMKRVGLAIHPADRDAVLTRLQELGVYHLETAPAQPSEAAAARREEVEVVERRCRALAACADEFQVYLPQVKWRGEAAELGRAIDDLQVRIDRLSHELDGKRREETQLIPWGEFDPGVVEALARVRVKVFFCSCAKHRWPLLHPEMLHVELLSEGRGGVYFVAIWDQRENLTRADEAVLARQEAVPTTSLSALQVEVARLTEELDECRYRLLDLTRHLSWLRGVVEVGRNELARELARSAMAGEGPVLQVSGFAPARRTADLEAVLADLGAVPVIEDPGPHEPVPVMLRSSLLSRLFVPITQIFSLPNYRELDTTPFFAPFYTLFFGLCVADSGYGVLMLAAVVVALLAVKGRQWRPYLALGAIFSLSVILAGVLLDDFFGVRLVGEAEHHGGDGGVLRHLALFRQQGDAMMLPILLGVCQVLLGFCLRVVNQVRHLGPAGALQPLGVIAMIFGALGGALAAVGPEFHIGPLLLGQLGARIAAGAWQGLIGGGVLLVLLFNGLEKRTPIYLRPLTGLWKLYELVTGLPGDILSYLRLFALGLAGGLLAEAVNEIAHMAGQGGSLFGLMAMTAVLIFGHALNLGIGLLSAFVHSLRLTFVEFYKAVEFTGGGIEYRPLRRTAPERAGSR